MTFWGLWVYFLSFSCCFLKSEFSCPINQWKDNCPTFPCQSLLPRNESGDSAEQNSWAVCICAHMGMLSSPSVISGPSGTGDCAQTCCWKHLAFALLSSEFPDTFVCLISSQNPGTTLLAANQDDAICMHFKITAKTTHVREETCYWATHDELSLSYFLSAVSLFVALHV